MIHWNPEPKAHTITDLTSKNGAISVSSPSLLARRRVSSAVDALYSIRQRTSASIAMRAAGEDDAPRHRVQAACSRTSDQALLT